MAVGGRDWSQTFPGSLIDSHEHQQASLTPRKVLSKPLQTLDALPRAGSCTPGVAAPHADCQRARAGRRENCWSQGVWRALKASPSLPPCPHGPVFPGIPWMLRWGFLEILFLRSWFSCWICLLPTLAFPLGDEGGEGRTLEVSGLGIALLTFALLSFPLCPYFITPPGGWMWEPQNRLALEKLVPVVEAGL